MYQNVIRFTLVEFLLFCVFSGSSRINDYEKTRPTISIALIAVEDPNYASAW